MNSEERSIIVKEKVGQFAELAKFKGYHIDAVKAACFIAGSKEMHDNFADYPEALDKMIELCQQIEKEDMFLQTVIELAGIKLNN